MTKENKEEMKTGYAGEFGGYRLHGKSFDADGNEIKDKHDKDCFCCKDILSITKE
jgi:hypothetical protein